MRNGSADKGTPTATISSGGTPSALLANSCAGDGSTGMGLHHARLPAARSEVHRIDVERPIDQLLGLRYLERPEVEGLDLVGHGGDHVMGGGPVGRENGEMGGASGGQVIAPPPQRGGVIVVATCPEAMIENQPPLGGLHVAGPLLGNADQLAANTDDRASDHTNGAPAVLAGGKSQ